MKDIVNCPCCPDYFYSTSKKTKLERLLREEKQLLKMIKIVYEDKRYEKYHKTSEMTKL